MRARRTCISLVRLQRAFWYFFFFTFVNAYTKLFLEGSIFCFFSIFIALRIFFLTTSESYRGLVSVPRFVSYGFSFIGFFVIWRMIILKKLGDGSRRKSERNGINETCMDDSKSKDDYTITNKGKEKASSRGSPPFYSPFSNAQERNLCTKVFGIVGRLKCFSWHRATYAYLAGFANCCILIYLEWNIARTIPDSHLLTKLFLVLFAQCFVVGFCMLVAFIFVILHLSCRLEMYVQEEVPLKIRTPLRIVWKIFSRLFSLLAVGCVLWWCLFACGTLTVPFLRASILGDPVDPCAAEGMQIDPRLGSSWLYPLVLPRRALNFFMGDEKCYSGLRKPTPLGFIDQENEVLVVIPYCPIRSRDASKRGNGIQATGTSGESGTLVRPRIYIERPEKSPLNGPDVAILEVPQGTRLYFEELEEQYGTPEKEESERVIVHRSFPHGRKGNGEDKIQDGKGIISAVEWNPEYLPVQTRASRSEEEKNVREAWTSSYGNEIPKEYGLEVLELPLGRSPAYYVSCESMGREEYFVHPVNLSGKAPWTRSGTGIGNGTVEKNSGVRSSSCPLKERDIPGNVLIILFDALSRQETARALPQFVKWMQDFHKRQREKEPQKNSLSGDPSSEGFLLKELPLSIFGPNTRENVIPLLSGTDVAGELELAKKWKEQRDSQSTDGVDMMTSTGAPNILEKSIFNLVKRQYGERVSTSWMSGYCNDWTSYLITSVNQSSGNGGSLEGIDYYMYRAFCHEEYGVEFGNFKGPYSICQRCIHDRNVHEYVFDYMSSLVYRQMKKTFSGSRNPKSHGDTSGLSNSTDSLRGSFSSEQLKAEEDPCHGKYHFFDFVHFIESHEGTQAVISIVDDDLTLFMDTLEKKLQFFDDPRNVLFFLGDHGNHMGPYFEGSEAVQFERTTPASLMVIHPETLRRVDRLKGRSEGTSQANFEVRSRRFTTEFDLFLTIGDILGLPDLEVGPNFRNASIPVKSLFDLRQKDEENVVENKGSGPAKNCKALFPVDDGYCTLHFCSKRDL